MGRTSTKFKYWGKNKKSSSTDDIVESSSRKPAEQENEIQATDPHDDQLHWNYVAFQPSNNPKYNNGAKATTLRTKPLQVSQNASKRQSQRSHSKRRGSIVDNNNDDPVRKRTRRMASSSVDNNNDEPVRKRTRRMTSSSQNKPLPILHTPFELKHILEGHTHFPEHIPANRQKKTTSSKSKGKKKESSGKRRGQKQQTVDSEDTDDDDDDSDNDMDVSLDIWACEFEPSSTDVPSTTVALCGGSSILFLDAQQGRYVKKYTHPEPLECFYTLAWSLLRGSEQLGRSASANNNDEVNNNITDDEDDEMFAAILAAAGKFGSIKLLEPTQTQCYRYLFGHQQPVLKVRFSKKEPRWLLSSSMDMTVRLWDIGTPSCGQDDSSCLAHFTVPGTSHPTSIGLSYDLSLLVVGTNKADLLQYNIERSRIKKWKQDTINAKPKIHSKAKSSTRSKAKSDKPMTLKPSSKFPHGQEWHEGYVEDVYILGQDGVESDISDHVLSRGSDDMELLMWNPKTSTKKDADIHMSLEWPEADDCTGMRFSVVEQEGQKLLLGGDNYGDIRLYNIGDGRFSKTLKDGSKQLFDPVEVYSHDESTHVIRDVCMSLDTKKFVAVDSNNKVFVWGCK